jgi:hypothetical protein
MKIDLTSDKLVCRGPYRLSLKEHEVVSKIVHELLEANIIRPSTSCYSSPAILVKKPNGAYRLCVDYRHLNKITIPQIFSLPLIEDLIDRLAGFTYYSKVDLASGYHQFQIDKESIYKTAFGTPDRLYEFLRVSFGLGNAVTFLHKTLSDILAPMRSQNKIILYMDDILIPSRTIPVGLDTLKHLFTLLRANNLKQRLSKCSFFLKSLTVLGFEISKVGIRPNKLKIEAVEKFPTPTNPRQVRQFLGLTSHFRKFVPQFATKTKPLTHLLKIDVPWHWGEQQDKVVADLKLILTSEPTLTLFTPGRETLLYTDASMHGLAAVLVQEVENKEKPIAHYSCQTTPSESRYHSFELETLAVIKAVKRFRHYLLGHSFTLITDCNSLKTALEKKELNARIARWIIALQEFDFTTVHKPGTHLGFVDALSRNPIPGSSLNVHIISPVDWISAAQSQDKSITSIIEIIITGERFAHKDLFTKYGDKGGRL